MEIEMEEIIVDEELEIEDVELDVIKEYSGEGTSDYKKSKNKPQINGVELVGNKTTEELGIEIPNKTSDLENDSGFLENKGTFNTWEELEGYEFKYGEMFLFTLSGALASCGGTYIGQHYTHKSGENYLYRYIQCCNINTLQSLTIDILYKKINVRQMNIQDTNNYFTSEGLDDILQEIGGQLNGIEELLGGI